MNKDRAPIPCASNLLWYMKTRIGTNGIAHISCDDVMKEFLIDSYQALELFEEVISGMGFAVRIANDQYQITDAGEDEITFLQQFVRVTSNRLVNPRNAVRISVKLREWLKGVDPQTVSMDDANFITRLNAKNKHWTDEEIEAAWRMYQSNAKSGF